MESLGCFLHGLACGCVLLAEVWACLLCQMSPLAASARTRVQGASATYVARHPAHQGQEAHDSVRATGSGGEHAFYSGGRADMCGPLTGFEPVKDPV